MCGGGDGRESNWAKMPQEEILHVNSHTTKIGTNDKIFLMAIP